MRNSFINELCSQAKTHSDIFLLTGDLGFSVLEPFADQFPDRYLNVGIAEQNMTQVAAGLALEGYNVFTYSIGNFPTLRCMEQIRYDVCYHNLNVKIVAVGGGYAYGPQGVSHHTTEDLSMLRSIPNLQVCAPADPVEAVQLARHMAKYKGPGYIRLNKTGEPLLHHPHELQLEPGKPIRLKHGTDVAVLCTGAITSKIMADIQFLNKNWSLYSSPFIGNYNENSIIEICKNHKTIITVEENQLNGGFGSSIIEAISDLHQKDAIHCPPKVKRVGIGNKFINECGSQEYLREIAGLTLIDV